MFDFDDYLLPFSSESEIKKFAKDRTTGAESVEIVSKFTTHYKVKLTLGNGRVVLAAVYNPVGMTGRRLEIGGITLDEIEDFRAEVFKFLGSIDQDEKINIWTGATLLVNEFGVPHELATAFIKDYMAGRMFGQ